MKKFMKIYWSLVWGIGLIYALKGELSKSQYEKELKTIKSNAHKSFTNLKNALTK